MYFEDMDKTSKKRNHLRKVVVLALVAAAALFVHSGTLNRQASPPVDNIPPAIVYTLPEPADTNVRAATDESAVRKERRSILPLKILRAAVTLLSFAVPLILRALTMVGAAILTPLLSPAAAAIAALASDSIATFLLMVSMFSLLYKLTYPGSSLRGFFTLRNILIMLTASAAVTLVLRFDPQRLSNELIELIHISGAGLITVLGAAKVLSPPAKKSAPANRSRSAKQSQS